MTEGSSLWSALFSVVYGLPSLSCRSHGRQTKQHLEIPGAVQYDCFRFVR